ncbi:MAG: hypothetical protein LQ338_004533 [Usnochroma carphineum]|nr:MAG: hypothetical protein LQ338_004533 [Usnochroma carphineum]
MAAAENAAPEMVDPAIFEQLQANIDDDARVREELRNILQKLQRQVQEALSSAWPSIVEQGSSIKELESVASKHPYYKYNGTWTKDIQDTARLAVNSVTLGDYQTPLQISKFVKDIHAGFQILNLKNDSLRRRSDSIKYNVKKIEDVVYDLSLRDLVPRTGS